MFEFWDKLSPTKKFLIILAIILVVVIITIFVIRNFNKSKEGYTTALNGSQAVSNDTGKSSSNDPLKSYVDGWINSVRNLYSSKTEPYVE